MIVIRFKCLLVFSYTHIYQPLTYLFNLSLKKWIFPHIWGYFIMPFIKMVRELWHKIIEIYTNSFYSFNLFYYIGLPTWLICLSSILIRVPTMRSEKTLGFWQWKPYVARLIGISTKLLAVGPFTACWTISKSSAY